MPDLALPNSAHLTPGSGSISYLVPRKPTISGIKYGLKKLGADHYDLLLPETKILSLILHPGERIFGVVYGRYNEESVTKTGRGLLLATDRRVLLVDKKPLFIRNKEISYPIISAVTYSRVGVGSTITLHTRIGNILVRTLNQTCAHNFVEAIETQIFNHNHQSLG